MIDLKKTLSPKEFNVFKEDVIGFGVDLDLHISLDNLPEMVKEFKSGSFIVDGEIVNFEVDEETIEFWVKKLKPEMVAYAKNQERERTERDKLEKQSSINKEKFIKMRAQGKSVKFITESLKLSIEDVKSWLADDPDFHNKLNYESSLFVEDLQNNYLSSKIKRIEFIGKALKGITDTIEKRGFEDVPTDKLLDYAIKYMGLLETEKTAVNLTVVKEESFRFDSGNTSTNKYAL